jgi:hypothetical protein
LRTSPDIIDKLLFVIVALDEAGEGLAALKIAEAIEILESSDSSSAGYDDHNFGNDN